MFDAATTTSLNAGGLRLLSAAFVALLPLIAGQKPEGRADRAEATARMLRERIIAIYVREAAGYSIFRDDSRSQKVVLRREPVYVWTNPTRAGGQDGAVFVWTCRGRAEVVGTIFSFPGKGERRTVDHEFLSIATTVPSRVDRTGTHSPKGVLWSHASRASRPALRTRRFLPAHPSSDSLRCAT